MVFKVFLVDRSANPLAFAMNKMLGATTLTTSHGTDSLFFRQNYITSVMVCLIYFLYQTLWYNNVDSNLPMHTRSSRTVTPRRWSS